MSCLSFAVRNKIVINRLPPQNIINKFILSFSTTSNRLVDAKKETSNQSSHLTQVSVPPRDINDEGEQFRYLLRNSSFINLGEPEGKIVKGKIFHTVKDDLYIDFGWKFYCVCPRPSKNGRLYVRGSTVLLKIKDLELSSKFLGSDKDLTLLEADASIVRLTYSPAKSD